jgi:hypothetical protein
MSQVRRGVSTSLQPLIHRALGIASPHQMMGQDFGLALGDIREIPLQCPRDPSVKLLSSAAKQHFIGGVLHQRMLEEVGGMWSRDASNQQSCICKLLQGGFQLPPITLRDRFYQFIGKLPPEHRADLGNLL